MEIVFSFGSLRHRSNDRSNKGATCNKSDGGNLGLAAHKKYSNNSNNNNDNNSICIYTYIHIYLHTYLSIHVLYTYQVG